MSGNEVFITGPSKELIVINGRNIYPHAIEDHIGICATKCISAAFAADGEHADEIAIIHEVTADEISALMQYAAAIKNDITRTFDVSVALVLMVKRGTILRTTSSKIKHKKTKALWLEQKLAPLFASPLIL
ncbi:MAG: hypothetical protein H7240_10860 [Glaciimonas sp.]|nr:hypothetical protein [Glaciimonas sp.]